MQQKKMNENTREQKKCQFKGLSYNILPLYNSCVSVLCYMLICFNLDLMDFNN